MSVAGDNVAIARLRCWSIGVLLLVGSAMPARAQQPDLTRGQTIRVLVRAAGDSPMVGRVEGIDSSAILLVRRMDAPATAVAWNTVRRIDVPAPNPGRWRQTGIGALIGTGVGLGSFLYIASRVGDACRDCTENTNGYGVALVGASFTVAGGLLGAGIGRLTVRPVWKELWSAAP